MRQALEGRRIVVAIRFTVKETIKLQVEYYVEIGIFSFSIQLVTNKPSKKVTVVQLVKASTQPGIQDSGSIPAFRHAAAVRIKSCNFDSSFTVSIHRGLTPFCPVCSDKKASNYDTFLGEIGC